MNSDTGSGRAAESSVPADVDRDVPPLSRWQKFRLIVKVVELRLRFIALMAVTALVFAYWDDLWNRYDKWMRPAASQHAAVSDIEYYCPMHPQVVQDEHGSCPICGMPLAKRKKGEKATLPDGVTARVELAPFRVAQAGIKTALVGYAPLIETVKTVGYVAFDERRMAKIVSKVPGKISGREALRQFHRPGCGGWPDPGRALQPRVEPGDPGVAQRVRAGGAVGPAANRPWPARSWPIVRR